MIQKRITKDGNPRYMVRLFRGRDPVTGRRIQSARTFGTLKDARRWETAQRRALDAGVFVEPTTQTLGAYLTGWLEGAAKLSVRARTLHGYRGIVRRYVLPSALAPLGLSRLTTAVFEAFYAGLSGRGLSPRTVRFTHSVLHTALERAVKGRALAHNPSNGATLPRQNRTEMKAFSAEEARRFLEVSERAGNRWHALWHVLLHGGLRPSEALGLKWTDLAGDRVTVNRALVSGLKGGGWHLEEPKTRGSRRVVTLPAATIQALGWHRTKQEGEKLAAGSAYTDHGFMFATERGTPGSLRNIIDRHFKPLLATAVLPSIRVYDLRHSHATLMLAAGVPVKVVAERLGHASTRLTLDTYAHCLPGMQEDAVERLEAYMEADAAL